MGKAAASYGYRVKEHAVGAGKNLWFALMPLYLISLGALAQGNLPWQEYSRLAGQAREIAPLSTEDMFGDSVDPYSGALSFSVTDVTVPGNNQLPVAIARSLAIHDRRNYGLSGRGRAFADWDIDIPRVHGVFAKDWHEDRCSRAVPPTINYRIRGDEYWAGNHANLPGGGEMLRVDTTHPQPAMGGPYVWLTEGNTYFSCLPSIKNGAGEGFLAIDASGNKYWLDHMAQYGEPSFTHADNRVVPQRMTVERRKNVLYATRVEDRYGNWVNYSYSNVWNQPVRLTGVSTSDGRSLSLLYNVEGFVSSVSDGARTWAYGYTNKSLSSVLLPDGSSWSMSLAALSSAEIHLSDDPNDMRTCFSMDFALSGDAVGSITHPSGATATFVVGPQELGRSNVPGVCRNYAPPGSPENDTRDDYPVFPVHWMSLVIRGKHVEGAGIVPLYWAYDFGGGWSWQFPAGQTQPICQATTCADPVCVSDDCAGRRTTTILGPGNYWERYTFGNSYRYDEGKLLVHEVGGGPSSILRRTTNSYNYAMTGQTYAARIGTSPQTRGAGFNSEYPRPLIKRTVLQDSALFTWEVDQGCSSTGTYCMDALARPTRIVRTGVTPERESGPAAPPQSAPTLSAPLNSSTGSYPLSWTSVELVSEYELQEQSIGGVWSSIQVSSLTSIAINSNSTATWSYRVRACNTVGCSGWSAVSAVQVVRPPSVAPTISAPASNSTGNYTVTWTAVAEANTYELAHRRNGGAWSRIYVADTMWSLNGLTTGTYDYMVRGCNSGGCGPDSTIGNTLVTLLALNSPTLAAIGSSGQDQPFIVSWSGVAGATSYSLELSNGGGPYSVVYSGGLTSVTQSISMIGNYLYRVKACAASGCGANSNTRSVRITVGP